MKQRELIHSLTLESETNHRDIARLEGTIETTKKVCNAYRNNGQTAQIQTGIQGLSQDSRNMTAGDKLKDIHRSLSTVIEISSLSENNENEQLANKLHSLSEFTRQRPETPHTLE